MIQSAADIFLYLGIGLFLVAAVALVRPMPRLLLGTRKAAALALCVSAASCTVGASLLPKVGRPPATATATLTAPPPLTAAAPAKAASGLRKIDQVDVGGPDLAAPEGRFDVAVLDNDDGTQSLWARAYVTAEDHFAFVEKGGEAAAEVIRWCRSEGVKDCSGVRDGDVWIQRAGEKDGSLALRLSPSTWKTAVSSHGAIERAQPYSADHYGRAALGVWCRINRESPADFCKQARKLIEPVPLTN